MYSGFGNIESFWQKWGFTDAEISLLKTKQVVFILDGMDEIPVSLVPPVGIVEVLGLLSWGNAKIILTSSEQYLLELEKLLGTKYYKHFTQGKVAMDEFFLQPFDDAQIALFLQHHSIEEKLSKDIPGKGEGGEREREEDAERRGKEIKYVISSFIGDPSFS